MTDRQVIETAIKRRLPMQPRKQKALNNMFETADDLHWTCPECKTKRVGTLAQLKEGCLQCLSQ